MSKICQLEIPNEPLKMSVKIMPKDNVDITYDIKQKNNGGSESLQERKENFLRRSNEIHRCKYDYSETNYKCRHSKVIIICPSHGRFTQTPCDHVRGRGCPHCSKNVKDTNSNFTYQSQIVHGSRYNYSKVQYVNRHSKVLIGCHKHGQFRQTPHEHLKGRGCRECGIENRKWNNGFKWDTYTFSDGRTEKVQGYETLTINYLISSSISPSEIRINHKEKPVVSYEWSGSIHRYFPDCYLPSSKTIVETKSVYTWNFQERQNMAKIKGSIDNGYIVRVCIWDRNHKLISDKTYGNNI